MSGSGRRAALATSSGLLLAAIARGILPGGAALVALVPLFVALRGARWRQALGTGWWMGAVYYAAAFPWVAGAAAGLQHASALFGWACLGTFAAYHGVEFALIASLAAWAAGARDDARGASNALVTAAIWVLVERWFPVPIPWPVGTLLGNVVLLRQAAALSGVIGLSYLVVVSNAAAAEALLSRTLRGRLHAMGPAAVLLSVAIVYGWQTLATGEGGWFDSSGGGRSAARTVAVIQGGMAPSRADVPAANDDAWARYAGVTEHAAAPAADLIVWPETTLRVYLRDDEWYRQRVTDLARRLDRPLVLGALDREHGGAAHEFNAAYVIDPAAPVQVYHKRILFPFGEYIPGAATLAWLRSWRTTGRFAAGAPEGTRVFAVGRDTDRGATLSLAPSICFEAMWPGVFNHAVRDGAEVLINLTDDSWLGDTAAPDQHLQAARLRAVETRRWLVRASNSGISAFIDPSGSIVASMDLHQAGVVTQAVSAAHALTPYVRFGDWMLLPCGLLVGWRLATGKASC